MIWYPLAMQKHAILCSRHGIPSGTSGIAETHKFPGMLHMAFSVFVFRRNDSQLLIQKRNGAKRFGGLWANTCCSHPQKGEDLIESAQKRLKEECGFTCPLSIHSSFIYKAQDKEKNEIEYEYDTILTGKASDDVEINFNIDEIEEMNWTNVDKLINDMKN